MTAVPEATPECRRLALFAPLVLALCLVILLVGGLDWVLILIVLVGIGAAVAYAVAALTAYVRIAGGHVDLRFFARRSLAVDEIDRIGQRRVGVLLRAPTLVVRDGREIPILALASYEATISSRVADLAAALAEAKGR